MSEATERSDDEQFEDAQEDKGSVSIPITRVERTDDKASHGEVPGTLAHDMRKQDAAPDELEIVPEGHSQADPTSIPKTVVEKVDPHAASHGEVPGTEAHAMRMADAEPDEIKKAPASSGAPGPTDQEDGAVDDFDDFNEGDEAAGDDDDFGAFDEGDDDIETAAAATVPPPSLPTDSIALDLPPLPDFHDANGLDDISMITAPFKKHIFPNLSDINEEDEPPGPPRSSFLTERSQSLWAQLVAPPPLQPPNWVKSRTRRLFLVSLGVPVDLDEILPASKQKKLVLPSIDVEKEREKAATTGSPKEKAASAGASKPNQSRRGKPAPPEFDDNSARRLCSTTKEALEAFSVTELQAHLKALDELKAKANNALEYWLIQRDSAHGDKEAFEEVINNFVKHAKKIRT